MAITLVRFRVPLRCKLCRALGTVSPETTIKGRAVRLTWCCRTCSGEWPITRGEEELMSAAWAGPIGGASRGTIGVRADRETRFRERRPDATAASAVVELWFHPNCRYARTNMARRTLLVVDDDEDLRGMFRTALALVGYQVKEAPDGLEALRTIDADPPDAVVLDLKMPQVSGYDVLYDLRVQAHTRKIPVVVVTGSVDNLDHVDAACVLRKPVLPDELIRALDRCLGATRQPGAPKP